MLVQADADHDAAYDARESTLPLLLSGLRAIGCSEGEFRRRSAEFVADSNCDLVCSCINLKLG